MTRNEIIELLKKGFNVAMLAEAFDCSIGRINELKCEPVEGQVYHKADINAEALLAFAEKHEIDINEIDFETICANKKQKVTKAVYEVGTMTKFGTILQIEKIGQTNVYLIQSSDGVVMKSLKEIQE